LSHLEIFPGATFSEVIKFGKKSQVFVLLRLQFFLQLFHLILARQTFIQMRGSGDIFVCIHVFHMWIRFLHSHKIGVRIRVFGHKGKTVKSFAKR